jgi:hypothetical protein
MAEPDAPAALLLQGTTADVVAPSDVEGMARVLRERYEQFARGERPTRLSHERRFSRRHQAERLMDAIARSVSPRRQAEPAAGARPLARVVAEDAAR